MVEAVLLTTALLLGASGDDEGSPTVSSYVFAQTIRVDVGGGPTHVSAESNVPSSQHGYFPFRVFIDNTGGPREVVRLSFTPSNGRPITRNVEVREGERRTVVIPVPYLFRYGMLRARAPGITQKGDEHVNFNVLYEPQRAVLAIGSTDDFEKWAGKAPAHTGGDLNVFALPPEDAPTELAAYTGYDTVVAVSPLESLGEAQRRALEAYAATGGTLIVGKSSRGMQAVLPLLRSEAKREQPYGLGRLVLCDGCKVDLDGFFAKHDLTISPRGPSPSWQRNRYNSYNRNSYGDFVALLPQATAPIGRFLLIIALFTLAIGPGSIWVARRRGPAALLVTIPTTAFVTCSAIIGYSLIQDGFTVHASTHALTLLDSKQHRALNVGLTAYYANLAPSSARFSQSVAVLAPGEGGGEPYGPSIEWGDGATLGTDFVPSRTYREWGFLSAEPTRARVMVKKKGDGWVVQNALGGKLVAMNFMADDALWHVAGVADGAEAVASKGSAQPEPWLDSRAVDRFSPKLLKEFGRPLKESEFLATLEGQGFTPTGEIRLNHHDSSQVVRGEVER